MPSNLGASPTDEDAKQKPQASMERSSATQVQTSAVAEKTCGALTVHKCQGLTCHEGCIVDLAVSRPRNPVASLGLAFVAWTRVTTFTKLAFRSLPSLQDFYAVRQNQDFKYRERERESAELDAADRHEAYLKKTKKINFADEL